MRGAVGVRVGVDMPEGDGAIDADYAEGGGVMLKKGSPREVVIAQGERIAQIVLARYAALDWVSGTVGVSTDRTGGIGST